MVERTTFGIPVHGEIRTGPSFEKQRDPAELIYAMRELLSLEQVGHIRWTQYTPYFNDGDTCEFDAHEFAVYAHEPEWYKDREVDHLGKKYKYNHATGKHDWEQGMIPADYDYDYEISSYHTLGDHPEFKVDEEVVELAERVSNMLVSKAHDHFLLENFGDHTEVIFDGNVFTHEEYSHD